ncbi:hypothetical protein N7495_003146 [Penicillium taxi]|uniref:uncharacterized protein n=1 Tax=Penicillium taxi TaxID=168475 RepID=UPI002544D6BE|nr:uncharacterized protein N7495_003146 [Penicillium taxi]KAJ5902618.1 hypothetical protein N7495_003146 [Penicillium taxi]
MAPVTKSCLECRRRKIKCDRGLPCSYCVKVMIRCTHPPKKANSKNLATRVENLEQTISTLKYTLSHTSHFVQQQSSLQTSVSQGVDTAKLRGVRELPEASTQFQGCKLAPEERFIPELQSQHPSSEDIVFLWQTFIDRVHPILKIIHAPSVQRQITDFLQDGIQSASLPVHCLLHAIYYASVITLSVEECKNIFYQYKQDILEKYRKTIQKSLAEADFETSADLNVLQAFVLYIVCGRFDEHGTDVKRLTSIGITMVLNNGLNNQVLSQSTPFEAEMRRRLWWQIFVLDVRMAEDARSEPCILESQFRNKFPSNFNDTILDPRMSQVPKDHSGKTEMLFSLIRLEISYFCRLILFSNQFCERNLYPIMCSSEKCGAIDRFKERIELEYLANCDTSIPLDFFTAESSRLILANLKLTVCKPRSKNEESQQMFTQDGFRGNCVDILERARAMRLHEQSEQWLWLFQRYVEWGPLAYLLINLSLSPNSDGVDVAWRVADDIYQYWSAHSGPREYPGYTYLQELYAQASLTRIIMPLSTASMTGSLPYEQNALEEPLGFISQTDESPDMPVLCSQTIQQAGLSDQGNANNMSRLMNISTVREIFEAPSSGTAYQWSAEQLLNLFFEGLDLEQNMATWL